MECRAKSRYAPVNELFLGVLWIKLSRHLDCRCNKLLDLGVSPQEHLVDGHHGESNLKFKFKFNLMFRFSESGSGLRKTKENGRNNSVMLSTKALISGKEIYFSNENTEVHDKSDKAPSNRTTRIEVVFFF
jgi:hypothetical protein